MSQKLREQLDWRLKTAKYDARSIDWHYVAVGDQDFADLARRRYEIKRQANLTAVDAAAVLATVSIDPMFSNVVKVVGNIPYVSDQAIIRYNTLCDTLATSIVDASYCVSDALHLIVARATGIDNGQTRLYSPDRGVWVSQAVGDDHMSADAVLGEMITRYRKALAECVGLVEYIGETMRTAVTNATPVGTTQTQTRQLLKAALEAHDARTLSSDEKAARKLVTALADGQESRLKTMVLERLSRPHTDWDTSTNVVVVKDGVLKPEEITTYLLDEPWRLLHPFDPKYMSTMRLDVSFAKAFGENDTVLARRSKFYQGVNLVMPDKDTQRYLQMRFGAALLGTPGLVSKTLVWQHGDGDTAKSTIQECIAGANGVFAPYAIQGSVKVLVESRFGSGGLDQFVAQSRGKRFAIMSEMNKGARLDREAVTSLTGGDSVAGADKYEKAVRYKFTATMFLATNDTPSFPSGDTVLPARMAVVPFRHKLWDRNKWSLRQKSLGRHVTDTDFEREVPAAHRANPNWQAEILSDEFERSSVLHWVIEGLARYNEYGLSVSNAMADAHEEFMDDTAADPAALVLEALLDGLRDPFGKTVAEPALSVVGLTDNIPVAQHTVPNDAWNSLVASRVEKLIELKRLPRDFKLGHSLSSNVKKLLKASHPDKVVTNKKFADGGRKVNGVQGVWYTQAGIDALQEDIAQLAAMQWARSQGF